MITHPEVQNANGGTELLKRRLYESLDPSLLDKFQIWFSRFEPEKVDRSKIQIAYLHDLPDDPSSNFLLNDGWRQFAALVFVSNWQMQAYVNHYQLPWGICVVIPNSIVPLERRQLDNDGIIRLGYWSTPHRGLDILVPVFEKLAESDSSLHLDVFSSFNLYGWPSRDKPFEELFERCRSHPQITYHGATDNTTVRSYVEQMDILAYPCTWTETSCLVLMEAMSAGLVCVHPNLGALYETAGGMTMMYQFDEDPQAHAQSFYHVMLNAINIAHEQKWGGAYETCLAMQSAYANAMYNWHGRKHFWEQFLVSLLK
jgi:UDP-glucose:(glucosyl)LPS alpha-1,2-glucosyltransferase